MAAYRSVIHAIPTRRTHLPRGWRAALALLIIALAGCSSLGRLGWGPTNDSAATDPYIPAATAIEFPDVDSPLDSRAQWTSRPLALSDQQEPTYRDITLQEAVHEALMHSKVIRDIGGFVTRSPEAAKSTYGVAIVETDPRYGVEAALSEFDAQVASSVIYEHNDRALNNVFLGGGTRLFKQRTSALQTQLSKRTAIGGEFFLRNNLGYDHNNAPGNLFETAWDVNFEAGFRQSLLQGAGVDVNRIAGTSRQPGVYQGVLIARANVDISAADFEIAVRNFVSDVENAYWDLYFAYRDLDAKRNGREAALKTWQFVASRKGQRGGEAYQEAQAREQYYRFQEDVQNALTGRLIDGTRTYNGSPEGTLRSTSGVHVAERRLRHLMDLPISEGVLLRPIDEPIDAQILFDWDLALTEALRDRAEIRRQKWVIKQRELELIAARNFLKPQLDLVGLYRWRGYGESLLNPEGNPSEYFDVAPADGIPDDPNHDPRRFSDAFTNLTDGAFQEWQLGVELQFPIGSRRAHAGVRNAEFQLVHAQAVLKEEEHLITRDLSNAFAEVDRAYGLLQTVADRLQAAHDQLDSLQAAYEADQVTLNLVLDAQRRLAVAESRYYEALVEHTLAIKGMQFEKGTLLEYDDIQLAEGPWSTAAHEDARDRIEHRTPARQSRFLPDHRVITAQPGAGM